MNMDQPWHLPGNWTQRLEAYLPICSCFLVKDRDEDAHLDEAILSSSGNCIN